MRTKSFKSTYFILRSDLVIVMYSTLRSDNYLSKIFGFCEFERSNSEKKKKKLDLWSVDFEYSIINSTWVSKYSSFDISLASGLLFKNISDTRHPK